MASFLGDVVATTSNPSDTATQDFTVTATAAAAAGTKLIVIFGSLVGATDPTVSVADSKGNTYTLASKRFRSNFAQLSIFGCNVTTPIVVGDTFTVTVNPLNKRHMVRVLAVDHAGALDVSVVADGATGSPNASLTPTQAGDFLVTACYHGNDSQYSYPSGYFGAENVATAFGANDRSLKSAYRVAGTAVEFPNPVLQTSRTWVEVAVAFLSTSVATNNPPTANAGPDQSVAAFATVQLDGSGSTDGDGTVVAYSWRQISGPSVQLSSTVAQKPTFAAPGIPGGTTLVFGLVATDNLSADSVEDTVTVTVSTASTFVLSGSAWVGVPAFSLNSSGSWG